MNLGAIGKNALHKLNPARILRTWKLRMDFLREDFPRWIFFTTFEYRRIHHIFKQFESCLNLLFIFLIFGVKIFVFIYRVYQKTGILEIEPSTT
jgi:hypothetical protein